MKNEDSILDCTKKSLGIDEDATEFDTDIIMLINSALNVLTQLGVGPTDGYAISSSADTWDQFLGNDLRLNMAKSYVFLKVKMAFDPPTVGGVLSSYAEQIKEYESRLNYAVDPINTFD
jgi:hypothetical protein